MDLGNNSAVLTLQKKKLHVKVSGPSNLVMKTWSTAPTNGYDAVNTGTVMVGFECTIPAGSTAAIEVLLIPEKNVEGVSFPEMTLDEW